MPLDDPMAPKITTENGKASAAPNRLAVIDGDVHPAVRSMADFKPYLSKRWWDHYETYGMRRKHGSANGEPYPKSAPLACRRDAWPEEGGRVVARKGILRLREQEEGQRRQREPDGRARALARARFARCAGGAGPSRGPTPPPEARRRGKAAPPRCLDPLAMLALTQ